MLTRRPILFAALAGTTLASVAHAQGPTFDGEWSAALAAPAQTLHLHLTIAGAGATLFSVDQNNARIPAGAVSIDHDQITLTFPLINARFVGRLAEGRITGVFTQGQAYPLIFERGAQATVSPAPAPLVALTAQELNALRTRGGAPAMAAAAAKRGAGALDLAIGLRSGGAQIPVTTHDQWHLGSITKSMTATLIARCVEAGAVRWDDTIGGVLGNAIPDMRAQYRECTFMHLMSHRAGLQPNIAVGDLHLFSSEIADPRAERITWCGLALKQEPVGAKEQIFVYSNNGPIIAGAMLEAKLGASWETLIRTRVFEPLGLVSAGFGAPGAPGRLDQPVGHGPGGGGPHTPHPPGAGVSDNPAALGPAGRVHMGLDDLLKYLAAHRDKEASFLRAETWDILHTPPFGGDYALGWVKRGDTLWHNGSNTFWYAEVAIDMDRAIVCAAAANDGGLGGVQPCVARALQEAGLAVA